MNEKITAPDYLAVMVDMAGCPNRCRHCWLGNKRNGHFDPDDFKSIAAHFRDWRDGDGQGIGRLAFFSWWREPDFRDDYRELWRLERELSSPGCAERFELLSTWRLARDAEYAEWAATLEPKVCQITFFGLEENTDWGMRRRGAFRDQLRATERCREVGITPRWQLFVTKRCLHELDGFMELIDKYGITDFFLGSITPEGCGYEIENERLEADDLKYIPARMTALSRDGVSLYGRPEREILPELLRRDDPPRLAASKLCVAVDADYNVYPNTAEPADWWCLGNLKTDGTDAVMRALINASTPGMTANRTLPVSELARRYGDPGSTRLYDPDDLVCRFMHQWGADNYQS